MTRSALHDKLKKNKLICDGQRLVHLLMHAELEGIICSGPRQGNQFTYALLEERTTKGKDLNREESLAELSTRYFKSRGPATLKDYCTWSSLSVKDAKEGIELVKNTFQKETTNGTDYFFSAGDFKLESDAYSNFLMPDYDEYGMSYKDRSAFFDISKHKHSVSRGNPVFNRMIIIDGLVEGTGKKLSKK